MTLLHPPHAVLVVALVLLILVFLPRMIGAPRWKSWQFGLVGGFFVAYLGVGLLVFDDFGLSIDEPIQRQHALISLNHILQGLGDDRIARAYGESIVPLAEYEFRSYGVAFHLPLIVTEEVLLPGAQEHQLWLFRHAVTFLFFYLGVIALYRLVADRLDWRYGLLAAVLLVTTPRIVSEGFFNVKDAVFWSAFAIALYAAQRFWTRLSWPSAVWFGLAAGFATNVRVIAIGLLLLGVGMALVEAGRARWRRGMALGGVAMLTYFGIVIVTSPVSWANPLAYLPETLTQFSDFDLWDGTILYRGDYIEGQAVPWHFIPVWMLITIPIPIVLLFGIGSVWGLGRALRHPLRVFSERARREDLAMLALVVLPIFAAIALSSTLYTGWRHFTFVYTPFLVVAALGLHGLIGWVGRVRWVKPVLVGMVLVHQGGVAGWMFMNHPLHIGYFSPWVDVFGGRAGFEGDYLRASSRLALEGILQRYPNTERLRLRSPMGSQMLGLELLPPAQRDRFELVLGDILGADLYVDYHRRPLSVQFSPDAQVFAIAVDGLALVTVYDRNAVTPTKVRSQPDGSTMLWLDSFPYWEPDNVPVNRDQMTEWEGRIVYPAPKLILRLPVTLMRGVGEAVRLSIHTLGDAPIDLAGLSCNGITLTDRADLGAGAVSVSLAVPDLVMSGITELRCTVRVRQPLSFTHATVVSAP